MASFNADAHSQSRLVGRFGTRFCTMLCEVSTFFNRLPMCGEEGALVEQQHAVFAPLDDHGARAKVVNVFGGLHQIRLVGELSRFAFVHEQDIDRANGFSKVVCFTFDPEVHGVERHEFRTRVHLR